MTGPYKVGKFWDPFTEQECQVSKAPTGLWYVSYADGRLLLRIDVWQRLRATKPVEAEK